MQILKQKNTVHIQCSIPGKPFYAKILTKYDRSNKNEFPHLAPSDPPEYNEI